MKKSISILLLLLVAVVVAAHAQPLVSTSSLSITFTPVLVQETVEDGHTDGNVMVSPTITFKRAYKVSSN